MPELSLQARGALKPGQTGGSQEPFAAKELQNWEEWEEVSLTGIHMHRNLCVLNTGSSIPNSGETGASAEHFSIQTLPMLTKEGMFQIGRSYEIFEIQIKILSLIICSYVIKLLCF